MLRSAVAPFGSYTLSWLTFGSLAVLGSGLLSTVALLACPVGMYLMMRMMMSGKK
jgi:hypothetical protein